MNLKSKVNDCRGGFRLQAVPWPRARPFGKPRPVAQDTRGEPLERQPGGVAGGLS